MSGANLSEREERAPGTCAHRQRRIDECDRVRILQFALSCSSDCVTSKAPEQILGRCLNLRSDWSALYERLAAKQLRTPADVSSPVKSRIWYPLREKQYSQIDILVNNAGICPFAEFLDMSEEIWDQVFAINLKGTFLCSQAVARVMIEQEIKGRIICISSIGAVAGATFQSHYCPTKAGVNLFVKSIATALGPDWITVNAVMPGAILTDLSRTQFTSSAEVEKSHGEKIPVGRLGAPEDVAAAVGFLAAEEASYINGASLVVDGGFIAHL